MIDDQLCFEAEMLLQLLANAVLRQTELTADTRDQ
jgi:hypothetical protein